MRLYVGNISFKAKRTIFASFFHRQERFSSEADRDAATGGPQRVRFVEMANEEDAKRLLRCSTVSRFMEIHGHQ
jgi:hypothetical protein